MAYHYHHPPTTTSISSTMFRAVVFNNEGVRRMEHEMFDDAVISFTAVLQELNPILPHSPAQHMLRDSSTVTTPSATPLQVSSVQRNNEVLEQEQQQQQQYHLQQQQQQQDETSSSETRKEWESSSSSSSTLPWPSHGSGGGCGPSGGSGQLRIDDHDNTSIASDCCGQQHFIFRDPIEIPFEVVPTMTEPSDRLINKFVVVILYNLALSVHMSAVQHHDRTCLIRARKLYELAFQMHLEDSCDVTLLYSLALMNNLGLIYHLLGEEDRSQTCFKNMLATMMYLLESDEAKTIKQWDGLLSNVMDRMFKGQEVAAPAA